MSLIKTNCMNRALAYKKTESYEIKNAEKPKQVNIKKYSFPLPLEKKQKTTKQTSKPNQYKKNETISFSEKKLNKRQI